MPAPTWGWLRMNDTQIEIPMSLAPGGSMEVDAEDRLFDHAMSFEGAVAELQARLDAARATANEGSAGDDRACVRAALAENAARNVAADGAAEMPGTAETAETAESGSANAPAAGLELPALSRYQKRAALEEAALDVATAFETGIGADARAYLNFLARETMVLAAAKDTQERATIRVEAEAGEAAAASIDVVAAPGSTFDLVIALDATAAMGADPSEFLGFNPFSATLEVRMKSEYANRDSLRWISAELMKDSRVTDVAYQEDLMDSVNNNLRKFSVVLLALAVLLTCVSFSLINSTVKLSVYSRRFLIHTMKLVGASWGFIRRPFLRNAIGIGLLAAVLACGVLGGGAYLLYTYEPSIVAVVTWRELAITGVAVFVFGIVITTLCSCISVNKFLRMSAGDLYKI